MLDLEVDELAGLVALAVVALRTLYACASVAWCWVTDRGHPFAVSPALSLVTSLAVATMAVALVSVSGIPVRMLRYALYVVAGLVGFILGFMFDILLTMRLHGLWVRLIATRVPAYRDALAIGEPAARLHAAERLAVAGLRARPALPELYTAVRDESPDVRAAATYAIWNATPDPAPDDDRETVPAVRPALTDPHLPVRVNAAAVLVRFKAVPPEQVFPALAEGLTADIDVVQWTASHVTGELGPAAEPLVPALRAALLERTPPNEGAVDALAKVGAAGVPVLIEVLERGIPDLRRSAIDALGEMGDPARAALPVLRKFTSHPDESIQNAAKSSLRKLGGTLD